MRAMGEGGKKEKAFETPIIRIYFFKKWIKIAKKTQPLQISFLSS